MKTNQIISTPIVAPERRPMFTRDWNISQQFARWLIARKVSPNAISLAGMAGGIGAGLALAATHLLPLPQVLFLLAVAGIVVRGMGNLLDGMVAVGSGKASPFGELFNEIPDRVADIAILIGAGYAAGGNPALGFLRGAHGGICRLRPRRRQSHWCGATLLRPDGQARTHGGRSCHRFVLRTDADGLAAGGAS